MQRFSVILHEHRVKVNTGSEPYRGTYRAIGTSRFDGLMDELRKLVYPRHRWAEVDDLSNLLAIAHL